MKGEYGYYVAFNYTTCKEAVEPQNTLYEASVMQEGLCAEQVMNDHTSFSSNPFPEALHTGQVMNQIFFKVGIAFCFNYSTLQNRVHF